MAASQADYGSFQDLSQNSQAARWFTYMTPHSLEEVMQLGYFDPCAKWGFRTFDKIAVDCSIDTEEPTHAILVVLEPRFEIGNDIHVEVRRWL